MVVRDWLGQWRGRRCGKRGADGGMMVIAGAGHGGKHGTRYLSVAGQNIGERDQSTSTKGHREQAERHSSGSPQRRRSTAKRGGSVPAHRRAFLRHAAIPERKVRNTATRRRMYTYPGKIGKRRWAPHRVRSTKSQDSPGEAKGAL